MIVNQIKEMDESRRNNLWMFSLRKWRADILTNAEFQQADKERIAQIIEDFEVEHEFYKNHFKEELAKLSAIFPVLGQKKLQAKIVVAQQQEKIVKLKAELDADVKILDSILANESNEHQEFMSTLDYLKQLKSINVELSMTDDIHEKSFFLVSKMKDVISSRKPEVGQKVLEYSQKLEDLNYFEKILGTFTRARAVFKFPEQPRLDAQIDKIRRAKSELESSLGNLKDQLVTLSTNELQSVASTVTRNTSYVSFKSTLQKAKRIKRSLMDEKKPYTEAVEQYRYQVREIGLSRFLNLRISRVELLKMDTRIADLENIHMMYPEHYSEGLVSDARVAAKLHEVFAENKKMLKYHTEYLRLLREAKSNMHQTIEKEKELDRYFAQVWSVIQSTEDGRERGLTRRIRALLQCGRDFDLLLLHELDSNNIFENRLFERVF